MPGVPDEKRRCFGELATVFPMGADGLRHTPLECMRCARKTDCLRQALAAEAGCAVHEEVVDRAWRSGAIGFFERWSRKKALHRRRRCGAGAAPGE
jgi:hypothetical protein